METLTAVEAKAQLAARSHDELLALVHTLSYRLVYAERAASGKGNPLSVSDPLFRQLQDEAWVAAAHAYM